MIFSTKINFYDVLIKFGGFTYKLFFKLKRDSTDKRFFKSKKIIVVCKFIEFSILHFHKMLILPYTVRNNQLKF